MAALDHQAIRKAYPTAARVSDSQNGAFDKDGKKINLVQSKIDAARAELDKLNYRVERLDAYPSLGDSLDNIYRVILAGKLDSTGDFVKAIKSVKEANPKP